VPQSWLRRRLHQLTADDTEREAEELQHRAAKVGAEAVSMCKEKDSVCIAGTIRSVTLKSLAGSPSLEAEVYDGSGSVWAVFLGRRRIPGIEAGRSIVVRGRLTTQDHRPTIFNPRYELLCEGAESA
jgi:RecJ-like exonuclease